MKPVTNFNIRVYGIIIENKQVLLSDETVQNIKMTKFPGGGLLFGEGPEDCIRREALDEFGQEIDIISHFYTTGFFQRSAFNEADQVISIYYRVKFKDTITFRMAEIPFDFDNKQQSFRWSIINKTLSDELTYPIDKYVANLLAEQIY